MIKYYKYLILFVLLFGVKQLSMAQTEEISYEIIKQKVEDIAERFDIEMDYSDFIDALFYYALHPLNLNTATAYELKSLGLLNDLQITNLLEYKKKKGNLETIYELKDISGFDYLFAYELQTFVYVGPVESKVKIKPSEVLTGGRNDLIMRYGRVLEEQKGFSDTTDSRYQGSPDKYYFRYRYSFRDIFSVGFLGEKDAGESFFTGSNKSGFDFYSVHAFIKTDGLLSAAAVGDYHLEFGQGLTLWSGLGFGKSVDALGTQKGGRGLRPNTSANENLIFRGAAITLKPFIPIALTVFYSNKKLDAGIETDTTNTDESYFSSIQESGLHRTKNEIDKEKSIGEQIMGGHIQYNHNRLSIGFTSYYSKFSIPLMKEPLLYQIYDFQGTENLNSGLDFSWNMNRIGFFGEGSLSKNGGKAMVLGMIANVHPRLKMSLLYRNFEPDYQVFYSSPIAESSKAANEIGLYLGIRSYIGKSSSINSYVDLFSFPWMKYRVDAPSDGIEYMVDFTNEINRNFMFYMRFKSETKMLNQTDISEYINTPEPVLKQSLRFNFTYSPTNDIRLQSRIEGVKYQHSPMEAKFGYLLFQDLKCKSSEKPFDISIRYAIFNTDSYDTRIYAYESDVLYKFSIPGYYYQGQRYYLMFHWDVTRKIDFWFKISQTVYFDRNIIGSGQDEIDGNKKSEFTAQMRFKF